MTAQHGPDGDGNDCIQPPPSRAHQGHHGTDAIVPERAQAKPEREHYWAFHCYDGLSVRLCQLCHEPDWDDLRRQLAAEREACAELADQEAARGQKPGLDRIILRSFAALLRGGHGPAIARQAEVLHAEHHPGTFVPDLDSCAEHDRAWYEQRAADLLWPETS